MLTEDQAEELEAQIENHGADVLEFILVRSDQEDTVLTVTDIKFEDDLLKVTMSE